MKRLMALLLGFAALVATTTAKADFLYEVRFDTAQYSGLVGDSFATDVYLVETITGASTSEFATRTLNAAKFRLSVADTSVAQITSFTLNGNLALGGFNDLGASGEYVEFNAASFPISGPSSVALSATSRQYTIGTLNFTTVGEGTSALSASTFTTRTSTNVATSPTDFGIASPAIAIDLDSLAADRSVTFSSSNISAVPEPSSMALLGLAFGACTLARRRRTAEAAIAA